MFTGSIVALVTPFKNGELDLDTLKKLVDWQIEQGCPQCGAPTTLAETDHLLVCAFCRTRLYLVPEGSFCYYFPPTAKGDGDLLVDPGVVDARRREHLLDRGAVEHPEALRADGTVGPDLFVAFALVLRTNLPGVEPRRPARPDAELGRTVQLEGRLEAGVHDEVAVREVAGHRPG